MNVRLLALAALCTSALHGQSSNASVAFVRAADVSRVVPMHITIERAAHLTIGLAQSRSGTIALDGDHGTASAEIAIQLSESAGIITFTSDAPGEQLELRLLPVASDKSKALTARGTTVRVVRTAAGHLSVEAAR